MGAFESSLPRNESQPRLLWRSCERWLTNFRIFRALTTESRSHFERGETVRSFTEVSLRHRRAELCRAQSLRMIERRLVAVCFSLSLPINWIYIWSKGGSFFVPYILNQCTCMWCAYKTSSPTVLDNCLQLCICRSILIFGLSTFPCLTRVSEGYFMPRYREKWKL